MFVYCNNIRKLGVFNATSIEKTEDSLFEVFSIAKIGRKKYYLIRIDKGILRLGESQKFKIRDESMPSYWVHKKLGFFSNVSNDKYDFDIALKEFWGPEEFISNEDFLFDIVENPKIADEFLERVTEKYKSS